MVLAPKKQDKSDAFEALRAARLGATSRVDQLKYEAEKEEKQKRTEEEVFDDLAADDFVVQDDDNYYQYQGWETNHNYSDSEEDNEDGEKTQRDDKQHQRKRRRVELEEERRQGKNLDDGTNLKLTSLFEKVSEKRDRPRPSVINEKAGRDFMDTLLSGLEKRPKSTSRTASRRETRKIARKLEHLALSNSVPASGFALNDSLGGAISRQPEVLENTPARSRIQDAEVIALKTDAERLIAATTGSRRAMNCFSPKVAPEVPQSFQEDEENEFDATPVEDLMTAERGSSGVLSQTLKLSTLPPPPDEDSLMSQALGFDEEDVMLVQTKDVDGRSMVTEEDGSLLFYYIDASEVNGTVFLFGKVKCKSRGFASACTIVKNMERNVFFLKRDRMLNDRRESTDSEVTEDDLYQEISDLMAKYRIPKFSHKLVQRNYAFELPGVPAAGYYLKVYYPYTGPVLDRDVEGKTFSRAFGTSTSAVEQFLLKRKLMGPCWIRLEKFKQKDLGHSWCHYEVEVCHQKCIQVWHEGGEMPPMRVLSLQANTAPNPRSHEIEIIGLTAVASPDIDIGDPNTTPSMMLRTWLRGILGTPFPRGAKDWFNKLKFWVSVESSERQLLLSFLDFLMSFDPDVVVGHQLPIAVLTKRMRDLKVRGWSRMGRLKRGVYPKFDDHWWMGRLPCDTFTLAQDLLKGKTYDLSELAKSVLRVERVDRQYDDERKYFATAEHLTGMVDSSRFDASIILRILITIQALPLTKQLTSLAGNLWARTLSGARAERNEYLLLHEFHRRKFMVPDKIGRMEAIRRAQKRNEREGSKKPKKMHESKADAALGPRDEEQTENISANNNSSISMVDVDNDAAICRLETHKEESANGSRAQSTLSRRKPAYEGGLVLEPKRGLYDTFILLLDFNSLYPSIIQEFNVCFTTVDRTAGDDMEAVPPSENTGQGILPMLVARLVERRKQIKKDMNRPGIGPSERATLDIKQKALKLTANSMYGCLGFQNSRFYAKPLASLITSKGRQILQATVDLASSERLDVIYGDTDSLMINSRTRNLEEAKKVAHEFRRLVNSRYKKLEIGVDGVYQRLLLLKKKKYAAVALVDDSKGRHMAVTETKGLDLVRRDWCELSHDVSGYVLQQILMCEGEEVISRIHSYLEDTGRAVREERVPLEKFVITKQLSKAPEQYADAKSQPHVQVAKRMKERGRNVLPGMVIPYLICRTSDHLAARARHPEEFQSLGGALQIDYDYYLQTQVHPPVLRLCEVLEGTDAFQIARCLALDTTHFAGRSRGGHDVDEGEIECLQTPQQKLREVELFKPVCNSCQKEQDGFTESDPANFVCSECQGDLTLTSLMSQLFVMIRKLIRKHQAGWQECDEPSCGFRTRYVSMALGSGCRRQTPEGRCQGRLRYEFSSKRLYRQLAYYERIFSTDKNLQEDTNYGRFALYFQELGHIAKSQMRWNANRYIDLTKLFAL